MRLFSHKHRPVHMGPYPTEKLGRSERAPDLSRLTPPQPLAMAPEDDPRSLGHALSDYIASLDAVRNGPAVAHQAPIPDSPAERAHNLKSAGYFLDAAFVGVCELGAEHQLAMPHRHPEIGRFLNNETTQRVRLRFTPEQVQRQMAASIKADEQPMDHHSRALVIMVEFPRDPRPDEPGARWVLGMQQQRAAVRAAESAACLAHYLRLLGHEARAHSATTADVDLNRLAVSAGLAVPEADGGISNPYVGRHFGLAVVTTSLELATDRPLRPQTITDRMRSKGPGWWLGSASAKNAINYLPFKNRPYVDSLYPTETLKRRKETTTFIDAARVPRTPKSSEFFLRAAFGDLGKGPQEASVAGYSIAKSPMSSSLRLALIAYSLLQRGKEAPEQAPGYDDPKENAALVKATLHYLGADIAGISEAPPYVWYSHKQDGTELKPEHKYAATIVIDQGEESMAGSSGDDWISSAQSMRTYMRASLVCGVVAQHLRNLGFRATTHSAAEGDVIQPPLVLLSGLGEVSRIGDMILNPFLGPRIKTGVLTTDFPMEVDRPIDFGLQTFCGSCNKCARECPSGAISSGPKVMFNGYEKWQADVEKCTRYRMTNDGGSMCGRCMKVCPWNLAGLFKEAPFRWLAMHLPRTAKLLARLDDWAGRGGINPVKKWWWDLSKDRKTGVHIAAPRTNRRGIQPTLDIKHEDQTLAAYPIHLVPPPTPMPYPVDREAGIEAYEQLRSPEEYKSRLAAGDTEDLVTKPVHDEDNQPVILARVAKRYTSSADGKIDTLELEAVDGGSLPEWSAGAHIDITPEPQFIRQFSLAGDPADNGRYVVGVLREDEGRGGSLRIHNMLKEGKQVLISRPRNHFALDPEAKRILLLAGGIGVTPLIAMGHELHAQGRDFVLYYKAKTRANAAFIEQLENVPWADRVRFHFSDENRLHVADVLGDYRAGDHLYTCGPAPFMDTIFESALAQNWNEDALHREFFSAPSADDYENHPFTLVLSKAGIELQVPAEKSAVEALEEAGRAIDTKCSDGICGVCATPYLEGDIEHRDFVLSKKEREKRVVLCCSRTAQAGGRLVVDL